MEVARSPVAIPGSHEAAEVAPPGARDAAGGFSQISTRDLEASAAAAAAAAAEPPAFGAARREARVVREGGACDEKESFHVLERWGLKQQISLSQVNQLSQPYSRLFSRRLLNLSRRE